MQEMEARVRGFYASWGSTAKGEDDLRRIAAELVEGDGAGLDAFNNKLRKRFYGTCLLSSAVRQCPGTFHQQYISRARPRARLTPRACMPLPGGNRGKTGGNCTGAYLATQQAHHLRPPFLRSANGGTERPRLPSPLSQARRVSVLDRDVLLAQDRARARLPEPR